ncbi:MAG: hypothetical protein CVT74_01715 [Alphaproteobacteria bacterium HGW-Alphaproteobacteria-13]|jgi:hypothetical protein|nr:MAG: hypothetical protein CVT74_01715 [Alphaproteobacteria bacterium HGW-Alphaproteobacteria-13]
MIYRTLNKNMFVGFIPSFPRPIFMTKSGVEKQGVRKPGDLPVILFERERGGHGERVTWNEWGRPTIFGGWSIYHDLFIFAFNHLYCKGTDGQRGYYAMKMAGRMMFGDAEERRTPDMDEFRGMVDTMIGRTDAAGERKYFQLQGADMLEEMAAQPTIVLS